MLFRADVQPRWGFGTDLGASVLVKLPSGGSTGNTGYIVDFSRGCVVRDSSAFAGGYDVFFVDTASGHSVDTPHYSRNTFDPGFGKDFYLAAPYNRGLGIDELVAAVKAAGGTITDLTKAKSFTTAGSTTDSFCPTGTVFTPDAGTKYENCQVPGSRLWTTGPCYVRADGSCPVVGRMTTDLATGKPCQVQPDGSCKVIGTGEQCVTVPGGTGECLVCKTGETVYKGKCTPVGSTGTDARGNACTVHADGECVAAASIPLTKEELCDPNIPLYLFPTGTLDWSKVKACSPRDFGGGGACPSFEYSYSSLPPDTVSGSLSKWRQMHECWVQKCSYPTVSPASTYAKMPFPAGSVFFKTVGDRPVIGIPANEAIKANHAAWVSDFQRSLSGGNDTALRRQQFADMQAGKFHFGWPVTCAVQQPFDVLNATREPAGHPKIINQIEGKGDLIYSYWEYFYGTGTNGYLLLVNTPYFDGDFDVIPWINPFNFIGAVITAILDGVKNLFCSTIGSASVAALALSSGGGVNATSNALAFQRALCGSSLTNNCPSGQVMQSDGSCALASEDSTWTYIAAGGAVALLGLLAFAAFGGEKKGTPTP